MPKVTFDTDVNEGAFFHEPWLIDKRTGKSYRYDRIPPRIAKELARQILDGKVFGAKHVELLANFVVLRNGK